MGSRSGCLEILLKHEGICDGDGDGDGEATMNYCPTGPKTPHAHNRDSNGNSNGNSEGSRDGSSDGNIDGDGVGGGEKNMSGCPTRPDASSLDEVSASANDGRGLAPPSERQLHQSPEKSLYYAVRRGRHVSHCVFFRWEDCAVQVEGFAAAEYKGPFTDLGDAADYARPVVADALGSLMTEGGALLVSAEAGIDADCGDGSGGTGVVSVPDSVVVDIRTVPWGEVEERRGGDRDGCVASSVCRPLQVAAWPGARSEEVMATQAAAETKGCTAKVSDEATGGEISTMARVAPPVEKEAMEALPSLPLTNKDKWNAMCDLLRRYSEEHGHTIVPTGSRKRDAFGSWISHQRYEYRRLMEGKPSRMTTDRLEQLRSLDFTFDPVSAKREWLKAGVPPRTGLQGMGSLEWNRMHNRLREYYVQNGHSMVPIGKMDKLGVWVSRQRNEFRKMAEGKKSFITPERIQRLRELDFVFDEVADRSRADGSTPPPPQYAACGE